MITNTYYYILDTKTGKRASKRYAPKDKSRCRARADKLDLAYGAVRYSVRSEVVQTEEKEDQS